MLQQLPTSGSQWLGVSIRFTRLRIVEHFQIISDLAVYDHPENIADLKAALEEEAPQMWEHLTGILQRVKQILSLLGASHEGEMQDCGLSEVVRVLQPF